MQTAEETTQAGSVSRQLKQTSGWASVGVGRTGTAPKSPGGGVWGCRVELVWQQHTGVSVCVCCLQPAYFPQSLPKNISSSLLCLV